MELRARQGALRAALAAAPYGHYLAWWKMLPFVVVFLAWIQLMLWIDKDAENARMPREAVNAALKALAGQTIEGLLVTSQGPGVFRLGVTTDRCKLALEVDRHGVTVESLEV